MGELLLVSGPLCRGQKRLTAILQKGLDFFQILLLHASVGKTVSGPKKRQINRYVTVASICASFASFDSHS